jgi:hypothetical protein
MCIVGAEGCGAELMQFVKNLDLIVEEQVRFSQATEKRRNGAAAVRAI